MLDQKCFFIYYFLPFCSENIQHVGDRGEIHHDIANFALGVWKDFRWCIDSMRELISVQCQLC